MEYQKIANVIDDTPNQPSKFRTRNWVSSRNLVYVITVMHIFLLRER